MAAETIEEMRANMDALRGLMPLPDDVVYNAIDKLTKRLFNGLGTRL